MTRRDDRFRPRAGLRRRANFAVSRPALTLFALFLFAPIVVDCRPRLHRHGPHAGGDGEFTFENFERMATRDSRLLGSLGVTGVFVLATLGIFNVTFALLLAC